MHSFFEGAQFAIMAKVVYLMIIDYLANVPLFERLSTHREYPLGSY